MDDSKKPGLYKTEPPDVSALRATFKGQFGLADGHVRTRGPSEVLDEEVSTGPVVTSVPKLHLMELAAKAWAVAGKHVGNEPAFLQAMREHGEAVLGGKGFLDPWRGKTQFEAAGFGAGRASEPTHNPDVTELKTIVADWRKEGEVRADVRDALYFATLACTVDGELTLIALGQWAKAGYPQVQLAHKYAAALLVTTAGEEVVKRVKPPWPGFLIEVPDGLIDLMEADGKTLTGVRRILVTSLYNAAGEARWGYVAFCESALTAWRFGVSTVDLLPGHMEGNPFEDDPLNFALTSHDERGIAMIGRLIVNTCLAMSDPEAVKKVGPGHKSYARTQNQRLDPEPLVRLYVLSKPVSLDYRPVVREYVDGTRGKKSLSVQTQVRAHFKGQHYGPKTSLYRTIRCSRFLRGMDGALIAAMRHALDVGKNGASVTAAGNGAGGRGCRKG